MARTISDEELQLKRRARRRLIGAIVLVVAMVVVLPMVLDSEPRPVSRDVAIHIPSQDSGTFTGKVAPLPAPKDAKITPKAPEGKPVVEGKTTSAPAKATPKAAAAPSQPPQAAKPAKAAPPQKETAKPAAKTTKTPARPAGGQFVVQVIALADAERAQQMQQQIAAAGIKSYTEIVKTAKGDVTRVRAGPYATRQAADKAREQLKALGMNGNVTTR
jgi:DedD protein